MNLPGFTAEASLTVTHMLYRGQALLHRVDHRAYPAQSLLTNRDYLSSVSLRWPHPGAQLRPDLSTLVGRSLSLDMLLKRPKHLANWTDHRSSIGTYGTLRGPMYSARGRMSLLSAYCSRMCAVQPLMRLMAKIGV